MLNRNPSVAELFVATHSKVDENRQRIWCDGHAKSVYVLNSSFSGCGVLIITNLIANFFT